LGLTWSWSGNASELVAVRYRRSIDAGNGVASSATGLELRSVASWPTWFRFGVFWRISVPSTAFVGSIDHIQFFDEYLCDTQLEHVANVTNTGPVPACPAPSPLGSGTVAPTPAPST